MPAAPDLITVSILDREYQFSCGDDERDALKAAALYLDEKMREVKASGNLMALERIAVMAALNISDSLLQLQLKDEFRQEQVDKRIRMLADELDDALNAGMN